MVWAPLAPAAPTRPIRSSVPSALRRLLSWESQNVAIRWPEPGGQPVERAGLAVAANKHYWCLLLFRAPDPSVPVGARCSWLARKYFAPSVLRNAVTSAIRMGKVSNGPTRVSNAPSSTTANGAAANDPRTAVSRQLKASPSGTPGMA